MDESTVKRHERLRALQRANLDSWRGQSEQPEAKTLDASIKKNTGFIKKCKTNLSAEAAQLLRDVKHLKLERYVVELMPAVYEGMQRCRTAGEYAAAIDVITALHARFPEKFTVALIAHMLKQLQAPSIVALQAASTEQREREEQARVTRQRTVLRVLGEMYVAGLLWAVDTQSEFASELDLAGAFMQGHVLSGTSGSSNAKFATRVREMVQQRGHCVVVGALQNLLLTDREHHLSIALATSFARAFRADLKLTTPDNEASSTADVEEPAIDQADGDVEESVVTAASCVRIRGVLHEYLDSAVERLRVMNRGLAKMRQNNEERLFSKGVIHADVQEKFKRHERAFEKLSDSVNALCDALGCAQPILADAEDVRDRFSVVIDEQAVQKDGSDLWEDDEERMFYENVLDLRSRLPPSMLEAGSKRPTSEEPELVEDEAFADSTTEVEASAELNEAAADDDDGEAVDALGMLEYQEFIAQRRTSGESTKEAGTDDAAGTLTVVAAAGGVQHTLAALNLTDVLRRLPLVTSRSEADQVAVDFCYVNSRTSRRALISALIEAPRRHMFVIPLYARIIATLSAYFPEVGEGVEAELRREFAWLARKRFRGLLDTRLKNACYIAELVKFRAVPLHVPFGCARILLDQLHVQNIEVLCALLEGCGRFLRVQPETTSRVSVLLDELARRRRVLNLDDRSLQMIENAHIACELRRARAAPTVKARTPYERYVRKLMYEDLTADTFGTVSVQLRRLPWRGLAQNDPQRVRHALMSCFTKVWKLKHAHVPVAAKVLEEIGRVHPWFRVAVVDAVLERVHLGLEHNEFARSQRRIAEVSYVGYMFACSVVSAREILDLVRLLVGHGHRERMPVPGRTCALDASNDYFRARLVCTLLAACGSQVNPEDAHAMYEAALLVQMYVLAKDQPLPVDIDYNVEALFAAVFAGIPRYEAWADAAQAMVEFGSMGLEPVQSATPRAEPAQSTAAQVAEETASPAYADVNSDDAEAGEISPEMAEQIAEAEMAEARRQMEALDALLEREEEETLEREFNKMMLESTDARRTERTGALDVGIPMNLIGRSGDDEPDAVQFALLTGKKQRPAVHQVSIPTASRMAQNMRQQEASVLRERAQLKRIVLSYERREAEDHMNRETLHRPAIPGATYIGRPSARRRNHVPAEKKANAHPI
ncbi:mRNA decay protein [Coemansia sp. RSA 1199]|nr:mRNA decay protein [Coemansia sp. RSA 1199]